MQHGHMKNIDNVVFNIMKTRSLKNTKLEIYLHFITTPLI